MKKGLHQSHLSVAEIGENRKLSNEIGKAIIQASKEVIDRRDLSWILLIHLFFIDNYSNSLIFLLYLFLK
jgi:hypothetical protein